MERSPLDRVPFTGERWPDHQTRASGALPVVPIPRSGVNEGSPPRDTLRGTVRTYHARRQESWQLSSQPMRVAAPPSTGSSSSMRSAGRSWSRRSRRPVALGFPPRGREGASSSASVAAALSPVAGRLRAADRGRGSAASLCANSSSSWVVSRRSALGTKSRRRSSSSSCWGFAVGQAQGVGCRARQSAPPVRRARPPAPPRVRPRAPRRYAPGSLREAGQLRDPTKHTKP
jgi:hypothetical protein